MRGYIIGVNLAKKVSGIVIPNLIFIEQSMDWFSAGIHISSRAAVRKGVAYCLYELEQQLVAPFRNLLEHK